jgi:hypothetical protein
MPPAHHCGLFARGGGDRVPHSRRGPHRAGSHDGGSASRGGRVAGLWRSLRVRSAAKARLICSALGNDGGRLRIFALRPNDPGPSGGSSSVDHSAIPRGISSNCSCSPIPIPFCKIYNLNVQQYQHTIAVVDSRKPRLKGATVKGKLASRSSCGAGNTLLRGW